MDAYMPQEFYMDNTMSRAPIGTECPRCHGEDVVQAFFHDEKEKRLRTCRGCKNAVCRFRWWCGRELTQKEKLLSFIA